MLTLIRACCPHTGSTTREPVRNVASMINGRAGAGGGTLLSSSSQRINLFEVRHQIDCRADARRRLCASVQTCNCDGHCGGDKACLIQFQSIICYWLITIRSVSIIVTTLIEDRR